MNRFVQWFRGLLGAGRRTQQQGIHWRNLADRSDERAARLSMDPPPPGRKTYAERYLETTALSDSEIDALIIKRASEGKEIGVLLRVRADRGR